MLVSCPSCGKRISDRAPLCPFCRVGLAGAVSSSVANVDSAVASGPGAASLSAPVVPVSALPSAPVAVAPLDVPMALPAFERGDFIGDRLQVIEKLGEGGFGIVYLARTLDGNEVVALKTLRAELLRDAATRAMFEKEARIWIDLGAHPNLVRAKWVSEIGGRLYIGMEYVKAGAGRPNDLEGHLAKGPIETGQALLVGDPVLPRHGVRDVERRPLPSRHQAREHPDRRRLRGEDLRLRHRGPGSGSGDAG